MRTGSTGCARRSTAAPRRWWRGSRATRSAAARDWPPAPTLRSPRRTPSSASRLAVRSAQDRRAGTTLLPHGRTLRCEDGAAHRPRARGRRRARCGCRAGRLRAAQLRPECGARGEAPDPRATRRRGDCGDRRPRADERGRPGASPGLPRPPKQLRKGHRSRRLADRDAAVQRDGAAAAARRTGKTAGAAEDRLLDVEELRIASDRKAEVAVRSRVAR